MKKIADVVEHKMNSAPLHAFAPEVPWNDEAPHIGKLGDSVYIRHFDGPIFFGFVDRFQEIMQALPGIRVVVMRMERVPYMDQSGLYAMDDAIRSLREEGIVVAFSGLQDQPLLMLERINVIPGLINESYIFKDFESCLCWLKPYLEQEKLGDLAEEQDRQP